MTRHSSRYVATAAALMAIGAASGAAAQDTGLRPGWSFEIAPYVWLPSVSANLRYNLPTGSGGGRTSGPMPTTTSRT